MEGGRSNMFWLVARQPTSSAYVTRHYKNLVKYCQLVHQLENGFRFKCVVGLRNICLRVIFYRFYRPSEI